MHACLCFITILLENFMNIKSFEKNKFNFYTVLPHNHRLHACYKGNHSILHYICFEVCVVILTTWTDSPHHKSWVTSIMKYIKLLFIKYVSCIVLYKNKERLCEQVSSATEGLSCGKTSHLQYTTMDSCRIRQ